MPDLSPPADTESGRIPRRLFLQGGATLLASVGLLTVQPRGRAVAGTTPAPTTAGGAAGEDLALYRPVVASSTAYAPTPGAFAVDRLARPGVRGSGWRAQDGDGQWIGVDLQGACEVSSVRLIFETTEGDDIFTPADDVNPRNGTTGWEVLSSYATAFRIEASADGKTWRGVQDGSTSVGGVVDVELTQPLRTRWIRMVGTARSNPNPLGLNGFQVFGTVTGTRKQATGWTDWTSGGDPVRPLRIDSAGTVPIDSGWNLTIQEFAGTEDGAVLSAAGVDTSRWLRATVPGTILASLVEQGHLPDPVGGFDNLKVPEALGRNSWWYRRVLAVPHRFPARGHDRIWLELDGINHHAEIWVDGTKVGEQTHPFARGSFDVTAQLSGGSKHVIAVRIDPMPFPGSPGDKGADGIPYADAGSSIMMRNAPTYLAVSGWDWMPAVRDRVMGIWNHVRLRSSGRLLVADPLVQTRLPDPTDRSIAEVTLTVPVHNTGAVSVQTTVQASLAGAGGPVVVQRQVDVPAGRTTEVTFAPADFAVLRIENPELWWPNGYGEPTRHELTLSATVDGTESDRRTVRVGLRAVDYESENPITFEPGANHVAQTVDFDPQQARYLRINSTQRATGFGVSLWTLGVRDQQQPDVDLARTATATASSSDNDNDLPANAIDGKDDTRWSSAYSDPQWIQLDLGAEKSFDQLELVWETAYSLLFTVQVSADGQNWTEVKTVDNRPHQLRILVNGVPVLCRGGNWGWDELLRRTGNGRMDAMVRMHRDMNFTMIRNWLGSSDREELYAACDANGILVWNDFPNAWFLDPPDHAVYLDQARDTVRRYRSHPSVVVWCGANEGTPSGDIDEGARTIVAAEHPDVRYISNSAGGVVSGGGPYAWIDPKQYYSANTYGQKTFGFHTEIGIPTIPVVESMRNLVGDEPGWPIDTVWNYHDWATKGNQYPQSYQAAIDQRLGTSNSLEEFCTRAQFVNFESMRAMFEAWNANLWQDATGLLLWMSNPAWHSTVWQTYDYDLDVNGSYYGARSGSEPLHVQADPATGVVLAVNHTAVAGAGATVTAEVLDLAGNALAAPQTTVIDLPAAAKAEVFTVPQPAERPSMYLLRLRLSDSSGEVRSENVYWRYSEPGDLKALNELTGSALALSAADTAQQDGRIRTSIEVRNDGDQVAPMVRLSLLDRRTGDRVLPTEYSDNYFWLLPGERRTVTLSCSAAGRRPADVQVRAQGYGSDPVTDD